MLKLKNIFNFALRNCTTYLVAARSIKTLFLYILDRLTKKTSCVHRCSIKPKLARWLRKQSTVLQQKA